MDNQHDPFLDPSPPPRVASWRETAAGILALAPALFIGQLGWVGMKVTDTALLGHVGTHALAAASLSDLWTMASGVLIQGRVLGIFVGNAVGAAKAGTAPWQLAGEWLQVSVAVLGVISCFVMGLWAATGPVLRLTRADAALIPDASYFSLVLLACIPARVLFSQLQQYLSAQRIVKPAAAVALVGLAANLLLGYLLVLGVPTGPSRFGGYGFPACPIVTSAVEWLQLLALAGLFCLCLGYGRQGWPQAVGWCGVSPAFVTKSRVREYLKLYVPAALSIASDFWRMSAVGAFAASLSTLDLAVFTASYRVMWISLVLTGSLTGGVGIKVAQALGASRPHDARRCVVAGLGLACVALAAVAALILAAPRPLAAIFSSDASVLDAFVRARLGLCLATISMNLAVVLEGLLMATGRTRAVLLAGLVGSWAGQVPAVALLVVYWRRSLGAVYYGVAVGYALLCAILALALSRLDWDLLVAEALARANGGEVCRGTAEAPREAQGAQAATVEPRRAPARGAEGGGEEAARQEAEA